MPEGENTEAVDQELLNSLSGDSISIIQIDLLIMTLYLSTLGVVLRETSTEFVTQVGNSSYTNVAFQSLLGSTLISAILYFRGRQLATRGTHSTKGPLDDQEVIAYNLSAAVLGSVLGFVCLLVGVIDGFGSGGIPIQSIIAFAIPIWLIMVIFVIISAPNLLTHITEMFNTWRTE